MQYFSLFFNKMLIPIIVLFSVSLLLFTGCEDEDTEPDPEPEPEMLFELVLEINPHGAGSATGSGEYQEGEDVAVTATGNEGWEFIEWSGATDNMDDPESPETTVTMPDEDITVIANFQLGVIYGDGIIDIDGNEYNTVIINDQEWMAENLRATRYTNGDVILTDLSDDDWGNTSAGAYDIYDHTGDEAGGINSPDEMAEAYGNLYNWYAVNDPRGLCPEGWRVPTNDEWGNLINFIEDLGYPNHSDVLEGVGNMLKSCLQEESPFDDCDTSDHPRWNQHDTHYGFDTFGFSALPGGIRFFSDFRDLGAQGSWWTSSEHSAPHARHRAMNYDSGSVGFGFGNKSIGRSVRCIRDDLK